MSTTTTDQRHRALDRANEIRAARAAERRRIRALPFKEAKTRLAALMLEAPEWLDSLPVHLLLQWLPRYGPSRIDPLLELIRVRQIKPVGELTDRQRCLLAHTLDHQAGKR